ncbi:MAG: hypothetical protein ABSC11_10355 [Smithella sp.]|jgi:hypothetical protein
MGKKFGISFSWKRAVGISGLKNKISRKIGVPLTKQGRQRKLGRMMGCRTIVLIYLLIFFSIIAFAKWIF